MRSPVCVRDTAFKPYMHTLDTVLDGMDPADLALFTGARGDMLESIELLSRNGLAQSGLGLQLVEQ